MKFKPGDPRPQGAGRAKGTPNKTTAKAREAIAAFVDGNAHKLIGWLEKIEQEEGARVAFDSFAKLLEYHIPKLARTEQTLNAGEGVRRFTLEIEGGKQSNE